ncbi:MAG: hypothetical protein H6684_01065 [Deltaproteobacteria bacterium]|nr:hypothetical protein [Deltaproteobacteria bacterium]
MAALVLALLLAFYTMGTIACGGGDDDDDDDASDDDVDDDDSDDDSDDDTGDDDTGDDDTEPPCDETTRPMILMHGYLAASDTYANTSMRFASNGYCLDRIWTFDYDTLAFLPTQNRLALRNLIDDVLEETGVDQIDLAGHSMGGGYGFYILEDEDYGPKIAHYAHIASSGSDDPPDAAPILNLYSEADTIIDDKVVAGATNVDLMDQDHYQVATSPEAFEEMYKFFNDGEEPTTTDIVPSSTIELSGRVLSLGANEPQADAIVKVYAVDPATGERLASKALAEFHSDAEGYYGPFNAEPNTYYEFHVSNVGEDGLSVHYYREPFVRSNDLVYLRTLPPEDTFAGKLLEDVEFADDHAVVVSFTANQALVYERDTFTIDGHDMATEDIAAPENTTIAIFYFDTDGDKESSYERYNKLVWNSPFLQGVDHYIDASTPRAIPLVFNGRQLTVRNWKSKSQGVSIAVFD